ncbi:MULTISPECIES: hypothetical protein [unclassified Wenzhouxiangella]|uniref:hypothetical protein n=1 Tax=unclassified Wenzhouxiangella TaxID=2613841 RepID=UPI000E32A825|nr:MULTISPECIES: hypothetical protein [unclassified Wenzhouxiangella]RFF28731.1 hypothetical protein DZK25_01260 [Wenzhouxiangella sp. 15181]RFP67556.1 hypothetical protein DZK26_12175 [Wenzhouxiangella sp. 15190]
MVFRARSATLGGSQAGGVYQLDLNGVGPVIKLLFRGDQVPSPNNLSGTYNLQRVSVNAPD